MEQQGRNGQKCRHENWKSRKRKTNRETVCKGKEKYLKSNKVKQPILRHRIATKKHICREELVSEVAWGLVPALKLRGKMNTDRERRTGEEGKKLKQMSGWY